MRDDGEVPLPVPAKLRPWITNALASAADGVAWPPAVRIPDHATTLVHRTVDDGRGELVVVGPQTLARYIIGHGIPATPAERNQQPVPTCLRLRLRSGRARRLLGASPANFVDRAVPLTALWGVRAEELADALAEVAYQPGRVLAALGEVLLDRAATPPPKDGSEVVVAAVGAMATRHRLPDVAHGVGVTERALRALFGAEMGLPPKQYARIDRVRRVLALAGQRPWAELAQEAGYYDQAHLIADFGAMMGVPPGAFLAGRVPPPTPCE